MNKTSFEVVSVTMHKQCKVSTESVIGVVDVDYQQEQVTQIAGTVYGKDADGNQGAPIGNFNGRMTETGMKYSFSEMSREQSAQVWEVIAVVEENILTAE